MAEASQHPASFRDPSGYIYQRDGKFYRQVNKSYAADFQLLHSSGLYDQLIERGLFLPYKRIDLNYNDSGDWFTTLEPQQLRHISYPYEWCFSALQSAALLTLELAITAMDYGMMIKDATPFNIQFIGGRPVLIDSLSFERYNETQPWIAYRQFIESFAAPLLLARYNGQEMLRLLSVYPAGIPLNLVSSILPGRSKFNLNILMHVQLQQAVRNSKKNKTSPINFSQKKCLPFCIIFSHF